MITLALKGHTRPLEEAKKKRSPGEFENAVLALAQTLGPGQASADIDPKAVKFGHLTGKVYALRRQRKLTEDIGVIKTATGGFALVRYSEPRKAAGNRRRA